MGKVCKSASFIYHPVQKEKQMNFLPPWGKKGWKLTKQTRQPLHYVVNKCYLRNNNFQDNIIFSPDKPNTMEFVCYTFVYDLCYITAGQRFFPIGGVLFTSGSTGHFRYKSHKCLDCEHLLMKGIYRGDTMRLGMSHCELQGEYFRKKMLSVASFDGMYCLESFFTLICYSSRKV